MQEKSTQEQLDAVIKIMDENPVHISPTSGKAVAKEEQQMAVEAVYLSDILSSKKIDKINKKPDVKHRAKCDKWLCNKPDSYYLSSDIKHTSKVAICGECGAIRNMK